MSAAGGAVSPEVGGGGEDQGEGGDIGGEAEPVGKGEVRRGEDGWGDGGGDEECAESKANAFEAAHHVAIIVTYKREMGQLENSV